VMINMAHSIFTF